MFNRREFDASLAIRGFSVKDAAEKGGINLATLYRRLDNDGKDFTVEEVDRISKGLGYTKEETLRVFFAQCVA